MGAGIAQVAAQAGHPVLLYDTAPGAAEKGRTRIAADLDRQVTRGKMQATEVAAILQRITIAAETDDMAPASLIVEAIVEDLDVKRRLFAALEEVVPSSAILATNTSSISITAIARNLRLPGRLVGMHFFNPAPVMRLVEVVSGLSTDATVATAIEATATAWGKVAVHAKSTPGFIVNRVARPYYGEALRLAEEQVADPATLDAIMTEGAGFRMGPFELMDLIGNDINLAVSKSVFASYHHDPRFRPSILQEELVSAGHLGRKTGRGFHDYAADAVRVAPRAATAPVGTPADWTGGDIDGVAVHLSDGQTARQIATGLGRPAVVHDLIMPGVTRRLAFAASADVPQAVIDRLVAGWAAQGVKATRLPDWPALVVLRTIALLANEGFEAVMQGVADEPGIDAAMLHGVNYPLGPMAWARQIGLWRILSVLDCLHELTGDPRYRASLALRMAV
jgi:3-hydroxybutyryl-CoA dehydrogenase